MITTKVSKTGVTKAMEGMWTINLSLEVLQDTKLVLIKDFSVRYKTGQDIGLVTAAIKEEMQKAVDDYMMEQKLFADAKIDTAIASLNITAKEV